MKLFRPRWAEQPHAALIMRASESVLPSHPEDHAAVMALVAIYQLLDERLPKPQP